MNLVLAFFLLILLVDWISFVFLLTIGALFALAFILYIKNWPDLKFNLFNLWLSIYLYFFSILIGLIFSRNKAKSDFERLSAIEGLSASIAHEIRTPLSSLRINVELLRMYLPKLLTLYQTNPSLSFIEDKHLKKLKSLPEDLEFTIQQSFLIIDMLLQNIKGLQEVHATLKNISIASIIEDALNTYPFKKGQKETISVKMDTNFHFLGNPIIMRHVIYNLLKNALYYTNDQDNPRIEIIAQSSNKTNHLYIIDNGTGIKPSDLPYIFEPFYSKTKHGTGVGLSFCKNAMKKFNGNITCESKYNHYTKFILSFPKIKK